MFRKRPLCLSYRRCWCRVAEKSFRATGRCRRWPKRRRCHPVRRRELSRRPFPGHRLPIRRLWPFRALQLRCFRLPRPQPTVGEGKRPLLPPPD